MGFQALWDVSSGWRQRFVLLLAAVLCFFCCLWYLFSHAAGGRSTLSRVVSAENDPRGLATCALDFACGALGGGGTTLHGTDSRPQNPCISWNLTLVPAPEPLVELPLFAWAQLHAQATWVLHFWRGCRGSVFPLYTTNAQFADSALLGPPKMQAIHGLRTLPMLAYTPLVVTQVRKCRLDLSAQLSAAIACLCSLIPPL